MPEGDKLLSFDPHAVETALFLVYNVSVTQRLAECATCEAAGLLCFPAEPRIGEVV
jgi:hypothetical protein